MSVPSCMRCVVIDADRANFKAIANGSVGIHEAHAHTDCEHRVRNQATYLATSFATSIVVALPPMS